MFPSPKQGLAMIKKNIVLSPNDSVHKYLQLLFLRGCVRSKCNKRERDSTLAIYSTMSHLSMPLANENDALFSVCARGG